MNRIVAFQVQDDYHIWIRFQDGETKVVDFEPLIGKGVSAPLLDKEYFKQVSIDDGGGLEWPNGMDFCPNYLRQFQPDIVSTR
jgi:hypothetical protein